MMSGDLTVLLPVVGLILLMLMAASVVKMYQQQQALRRRRMIILQAGIERIEQLLDELQVLGLSRELRVLLREELVMRIKAMQRVFPKYPGIDARMQEARRSVDMEAAGSAVKLQIADEQALAVHLGSLVRLGRLLAEGGLATKIDPILRQGFLVEVEEAKVRCNFEYHKQRMLHFQERDLIAKARGHLQALTNYLKHVSLSTELVQSMRSEVQEFSQRMFELSLGELHGKSMDEGAADASSDAPSAENA